MEFSLNPAGEEAVCDGPSTSTDDDADIDDSVPILLITVLPSRLCKWLSNNIAPQDFVRSVVGSHPRQTKLDDLFFQNDALNY